MAWTSPPQRRAWLALLTLLAAGPACGQTITHTGSWTLSVSGADLSVGAGSDFSTPQDSADNQILLTISGTTGNSPWYVTVYKIDSNWDPALTLRVIRAGDGTGAGSIAGGTDPGVPVPDGSVNAVDFFNGRRNRSNVPILLRIEGLSVALGAPTTYTTTVYYDFR